MRRAICGFSGAIGRRRRVLRSRRWRSARPASKCEVRFIRRDCMHPHSPACCLQYWIGRHIDSSDGTMRGILTSLALLPSASHASPCSMSSRCTYPNLPSSRGPAPTPFNALSNQAADPSAEMGVEETRTERMDKAAVTRSQLRADIDGLLCGSRCLQKWVLGSQIYAVGMPGMLRPFLLPSYSGRRRPTPCACEQGLQ